MHGEDPGSAAEVTAEEEAGILLSTEVQYMHLVMETEPGSEELMTEYVKE